MHDRAARTLAATYFDGQRGIEHAVRLSLQRDKDLLIRGDGFERRVPASQLQWPEPHRHGMRVLHLARGGSVQCADAAAWDDWCRASGQRPGLVARVQNNWRWVLASVVVLLVLAMSMVRWGFPALAQAVVAATPASVEATIGTSTLNAVDRLMLRPSTMAPMQQERLRTAFVRFAAAQPAGSVPPWRLEFRRSPIGPNAFALPGGTIIMTDELVALFAGDDDVIMGVLAHELGHVRRRHGMHILVQSALLAGVAAVVFGDFNTVFAGAPTALGNASYSRDAEREADRDAARGLKAAGISPLVMVRFFEVIAAKVRRDSLGENQDDGGWSGLSIASHPADGERIRMFREAAQD